MSDKERVKESGQRMARERSLDLQRVAVLTRAAPHLCGLGVAGRGCVIVKPDGPSNLLSLTCIESILTSLTEEVLRIASVQK